MQPVLPEKLDRLPYFYRWMSLSAGAAGLFGLVLLSAMHTTMEPLVLVPTVGWLVLKIFLLDPPRLRSIGWSPKLTILSFLPPVAVFLQLLLFFLSPKRA